MAKERKAYAPFSLTSEAGVAQTPVEGYIDVRQEIYPIVSTGTVNENGKWTGVKSDDVEFLGLSKAEAVGNGSVVMFPDTNEFPSINMDGFRTLQIALKVSNAGNYDINGRFGPDTISFANLSPIAAGTSIRIIDTIGTSDEAMFDDTVSVSVADAWSIFTVLGDRCIGQLNMQVRVANNSGDISDIEFGFRRLV
jgi:hypothetical protein|tara:strand:+ start:1242 stop:1826 length:585 start_codon:yes stop_codon:yes gene_type:complete